MSGLVKTHVDGRTGRILLDRPAALNALDLPMLRAISAALAGWRDEPHVHAVVIAGAGERAFCAGGDIRSIRSASAEAIETFFSEEYALNLAIATYPKPYVALIDGICMGGGIGVAVHGAARVVTEHAMLAMPETGIGLFPDIGATHFLPRLPGALGMFLGLTGHRLRGADAVHAGLATHFCPRADLPALSEALARDGVAALGALAAQPPSFTLAQHRALIDHAFDAPSINEVAGRLRQSADPFAAETLAALLAASPSSLAWSFAAIQAGADRTLPQCLAAETGLTRTVTRHPDFAEGVRAMVIDKDRAPKWSPRTLDEVDPAAIEAVLSGDATMTSTPSTTSTRPTTSAPPQGLAQVEPAEQQGEDHLDLTDRADQRHRRQRERREPASRARC